MTHEYIIVFIDEASPYTSSSAQWIADVNSFNSTNFDANRVIIFRVRQSNCTIGTIYPTNANPAMPIPLANIIDTPRVSPVCNISGESLTAQWLYNRLLSIINNISSNDTIKIFVDNSGSMTRSSIEPAVTQFAGLLTSSGATVYDQSLCSTERYFVWVVNAINNSFGCAEPPSVTPTRTITPTNTVTRTVTPTPTNTVTRTVTPTPTKTPKPTPLAPACRSSCCYYICVENYDEYNNCVVNSIVIDFDSDFIQTFNNSEYQLLIEGNCVDPFSDTIDIRASKNDCYGCSIVSSTNNNQICNDNNNLFKIVASEADYKTPTFITNTSNYNSNNTYSSINIINASIPDTNIRCCMIPSRTPSTTPTITPTNTTTPTNSATQTVTPTNTVTPTPTSTSTNTPTISVTQTITPTVTTTNTTTPTPGSTPTVTPSLTNTITPTTTITTTNSVTPTNSSTPPASPTETPTNTPTETPTSTGTSTPAATPTETPTITPTTTETPTNTPTETPTVTPTPTSTNIPTVIIGNNYVYRKTKTYDWIE
jgi:hypothetical protein